jgi:hypothetical protein
MTAGHPPFQIPEGFVVLPDPAQVSELLRDYAQPLLYADPAGPADVDTIRTAMSLAMICWNLPVYEAIGSPLHQRGVRALDRIMASVPNAVASALRKLIEERKTKYAAFAFLVVVEVTGATPKNASIVAEARLPKPHGKGTSSA